MTDLVPVPESSATVTRRGRLVAGGITAMLLTAVGVAGGWVAARQGGAGSAGGHGEGPPHDTAHDAPAIAAQTLRTLGVETGELRLSTFVRTRDVPGVVESRADSHRDAFAPVAGVVRRVLVRPGQVVTAGEPIVDLARDAYPRPNLALTDAVLRPLNEEFHRAITDLRNAAQALAISREELARIRAAVSGAGSAGLLPGRREIELANDERRALASLESARADARIHGLSDEDVARIESGGALAYTSPPVRAVLQRNRLWGPEGDAILDALPEADRDNPYVLAVVGELVASRRLSPALVNAVRTRPALANAFLDVAGLIQAGATAESLAWLAEAGALDPIVVVRCPPDLPDADVDSVAVRPGQRVEAGSALLTLADEREMRLVVAPAGEDIAAIEESYRRQEPLVAEPLVVRSGPRLGDVRVARMASAEGRESRPMAWISLPNEPLGTTELAPGVRARTWRLRAGTRYVVKVPVERLEKRFVLPADAVVSRGADQVVFLRAGSSFRAVAVHVEHRDAAVSVVADDGPLFEGDSAVLRGAYALSLALQAGQGAAADPHAGHQH